MEFGSPEELQSYAESTGRTYVSMSLSQSGTLLGTMIIELFTDICPRTSANFLQGIKGTFKGNYKYQGSPIHRIVKHAYIQGGDVVDGTGKGNPGWTLPDETFAVTHTEAGLVGMATCGEPHTASTQFYITLNPLKWLDGKRVVFGKVIDAAGMETLKTVEGLSCNNERPLPEVVISDIRVAAVPANPA